VSNRAERGAVEAIGNILAGSHRPFLVASGITGIAPGRTITEHDRSPFHGPGSPRGASENLALGYVERGVDTRIVRFAPTVHGDGDHGFMAALVAVAQDKDASAYIGDGSSRWAAIHRNDAGRVVRLGLERALEPGTVLHAVAETGVASREIAEAIGRGLNLPVVPIPAGDAADHFGWLAMFYGADIAARSEVTQQTLAWTPGGPTLAADLASGSYFRVPGAA
jgi:nucleoside-diphosphate-sugar epimerase